MHVSLAGGQGKWWSRPMLTHEKNRSNFFSVLGVINLLVGGVLLTSTEYGKVGLGSIGLGMLALFAACLFHLRAKGYSALWAILFILSGGLFLALMFVLPDRHPDSSLRASASPR
jgi:drug/metabolite transporter (DMT)-like permease